jgi:hypothetical protein
VLVEFFIGYSPPSSHLGPYSGPQSGGTRAAESSDTRQRGSGAVVREVAPVAPVRWRRAAVVARGGCGGAGRLRRAAARLRRRASSKHGRVAAVWAASKSARRRCRQRARGTRMRWHGGSARRRCSERLWIEKKEENARSECTVKRVRSAFHAMTGRGGRMTRHGGGSVRSQSSKLLE